MQVDGVSSPKIGLIEADLKEVDFLSESDCERLEVYAGSYGIDTRVSVYNFMVIKKRLRALLVDRIMGMRPERRQDVIEIPKIRERGKNG